MARAFFGVLTVVTEQDAAAEARGAPRRPRDAEHEAILEMVRSKRLKEEDVGEKVAAACPVTAFWREVGVLCARTCVCGWV